MTRTIEKSEVKTAFQKDNIVLRADIKPIIDGEAAHRAASPSIFVLTYLRIAIKPEG